MFEFIKSEFDLIPFEERHSVINKIKEKYGGLLSYYHEEIDKYEHPSSNYQKEIKKDSKSPPNDISVVGHEVIMNKIKEKRTTEMENIVKSNDMKYQKLPKVCLQFL